MKEKNIEMTVGAFVFIGLLTVSFMIIRFGSYEYNEKTYPLTAVFTFTNGVVTGAPVRVAGVDVGKVDELVLSEDGAFGVDVKMQIREGTVIREDARPVINSLGIMGEKYVEFLPVTTTARVLKSGDKIKGVDPVSMSQMMEQGKKMAEKIENVISGWSDKETQENIKKTIANMRQMTDSPNKENLSQAIANFKEFSATANRVSARLDDILEKNQESLKVAGPKLNKLLDSLNAVMSKVDAGEGTIGKLVKDESIAKDIKDFVQDIKANPWKLFFKTDEKKPQSDKNQPQKKGGFLFW